MHKGILFILTVTLALFGFSLEGYAKADYFMEISEKLGRGLSNIVLSPLEITRDVEEKLEQDQPGRVVFVTPFQGTAKMLGRMLVGGYEAITFFIPQDPILTPAYSVPSIQEYLNEGRDPRIDQPAKRNDALEVSEKTEIYEHKTR